MLDSENLELKLLRLIVSNCIIYTTSLVLSFGAILGIITLISIPLIITYYLVEASLLYSCNLYNKPTALTFRIIFILHDAVISVIYVVNFFLEGYFYDLVTGLLLISSCGVGIAIIVELSKLPSNGCSTEETTQNRYSQQESNLKTIIIDGQTYQLKPTAQIQNHQDINTLQSGSERHMVSEQKSAQLNIESPPHRNKVEAELNLDENSEESVPSESLPSPSMYTSSESSDSLSSYDINDFNSVVSAIKTRSVRNANKQMSNL